MPDRAAVSKIFAQPARFITSAPSPKELPVHDGLEIAFAGRSNVGKSSLLNALMRRKDLARTSSTPGSTILLNFFALGDQLFLCDLPGYGYARRSKAARKTQARLIEAYLDERRALRRLFLLIDIRRGVGDSDRAFMHRLDEAACSYQLVLTKSDKISQKAHGDALASAQRQSTRHSACCCDLLLSSCRTATGADALRGAITAMLIP